MCKPLLFLVAFLLSMQVTAQQMTGNIVPGREKDYINGLLDSALKIVTTDSITAGQLTDEAIFLAESTHEKTLWIKALMQKARWLPPSQSLIKLGQALSLAQTVRDTSLIVSIYNDMGFRYELEDRHSRALDCYFNSLRILMKRPSPRDLSFVYGSIGSIYAQLEDPKGVEYLEKAMAIRSQLVDSIRNIVPMLNLGAAYLALGDRWKGIEYTEKAIRIAERIGISKHVASGSQNLALLYSSLTTDEKKERNITEQEVQEKILFYANKVRQFALQQKRPALMAAWHFHHGQVMLRRGEAAAAAKDFHQAMMIYNQTQEMDQRLNLYLELSSAMAGMKNFDSAYIYYRLYHSLKDSFATASLSKELTRKQVEFEFSRIGDSLQQIQALTGARLKEQELIALQRAQEIRLKQALLDLSQEQEHNTALAFEKSQAELQEQQRQLATAEQEKKLQASLSALQRAEISYARKELEAQRKQAWLYIGGLALLLVIIALLIINYRSRQRAAALIAAEKLKAQKAESIRKMAEFEMHGLRAQLNPHFMFNSLNAIQEQILKEKAEVATTYLTRFSRMLRQLLENAEYAFIPVSKEIDFVQHYLSMEQLRMPDLQYEVEIDPALDAQHTMIPNMILQPYLENAVWHGLSHSHRAKCIQVVIKKMGGLLEITIADNGVGREKAAALQSKYRKAHRSKGMELLQKRYELIKREFGSGIQIEIEDLQQNGEAAGTRVNLSIPVKLHETALDNMLQS